MDYVIQPSDSLSIIAARFGVTVEAIVRANPILAGQNFIYPGQIIFIPLTGCVPVPRNALYIVQPGETLSAIALRFNLPVGELLKLNPLITNPNLIFPGQIINLPVSAVTPVLPPTPVVPPPFFPPMDP
ncbi:MAG: LysM peptidoglycan-binding domain-containing protein [Firmicutes bacterium]|nr:LysM peptidoglycan-binding domain-containing protein [Bacillota bacterium]